VGAKALTLGEPSLPRKAAETDKPPILEPVQDARPMTGMERLASLSLLGFGMLPFLAAWFYIYVHKDIQLEQLITLNVLAGFFFTVIETFSLILLRGFGRIVVPDKFMHWLGAATVGQVAGMLLWIIKKVF
jgi:hypothetical protein